MCADLAILGCQRCVSRVFYVWQYELSTVSAVGHLPRLFQRLFQPHTVPRSPTQSPEENQLFQALTIRLFQALTATDMHIPDWTAWGLATNLMGRGKKKIPNKSSSLETMDLYYSDPQWFVISYPCCFRFSTVLTVLSRLYRVFKSLVLSPLFGILNGGFGYLCCFRASSLHANT